MTARVHPGAGRAAEFFAGMGLVRRALESGPAGGRWETVFANDLAPSKCRVYRAWFGEDALHEGDVAALGAGDIPAAELWTASFPCTDLSLAGRGAGIHAGQSGAVWALLGLLGDTSEERKPRWVLFENVPALLTSHGGADVRALVRALNDVGYGVDPLLVNASRFTAQSRARVFLIATKHEDAPAAGDGVAPAHAARPESVERVVRANPDLVWHGRRLPALLERGSALAGVFEPLPPDDPRWWPADRRAYFLNQIHPGHQALARRLTGGEHIERRTAFRRVRAFDGVKRSVIELRDDGLAGCLRTPKGGSAKQIVFEAGRGASRVRFMTALEAARLQGVTQTLPDGFSETELLFALGDAVCVPAVRWVLDAILGRDQTAAGAPATMAAVEEQPRRSAPASIIATASS